jgi:hypothetical protein
LVQPDFDQLNAFFEENDCGLLAKVQNIVVSDTSDDLVKFLYGTTIKDVTIITREDCKGRWWSDPRDDGCRCKIRSYIDFAELADDEKEFFALDEQFVDTKEWEVVFKQQWRAFGDLPCPIVRSLAICGKSRKYWLRISKDDIEYLRWLKLEMGNDSDDGSDETSKDGNISNTEVGQVDLEEAI